MDTNPLPFQQVLPLGQYYPSITYEKEQMALAMLWQVLQKPDATWTCTSQRYGILGALDATQDTIVVSATGSGKTMVALIPAMIGGPQELTILVVPLRQLKNDYIARLDHLSIPYTVFGPILLQLNPAVFLY